MAAAVQVDIFSDVICPWCLIGWRRLQRALDLAPGEFAPAVRWLPFELNPDMPPEGMDRSDYLAAKFGGAANAEQVYARVRAAGAADGIPFAFERIGRAPSTFTAHRLLWQAQRHGKGDTLSERLFARYFFDGADVGDPAELRAAATAVGLDDAAVAAVLDGDAGAGEVRSFERTAHQIGVTGVPFFVFNGRIGVAGAQSPEILLQALRQARDARADAAD